MLKSCQRCHALATYTIKPYLDTFTQLTYGPFHLTSSQQSKNVSFKHFKSVLWFRILKQRSSDFEECNVDIMNRLGDEWFEPGSNVANWCGLEDVVRAKEVAEAVGRGGMEWGNILLVRHPEGNFVEVQERS